MKNLRKINVFKLRLSWLALTPQVWPKGHSEAHFEALKLTLWLTLWLSLAHSASTAGSRNGFEGVEVVCPGSQNH